MERPDGVLFRSVFWSKFKERAMLERGLAFMSLLEIGEYNLSVGLLMCMMELGIMIK